MCWAKLPTLSGSSGNSLGCSSACLCSSRDRHTALLPWQNFRQGWHMPPPRAEPTNSGLHFSQCWPWRKETHAERDHVRKILQSTCVMSAGLSLMGVGHAAHHGVVVALQTDIGLGQAGAVTVLIAAALRRAAVPDKAEMAAAHPR